MQIFTPIWKNSQIQLISFSYKIMRRVWISGDCISASHVFDIQVLLCKVGILWAMFQLLGNIKILRKEQDYLLWRVIASQRVTDDNVHVLFPILQVDVVISPVLADAGDPQKIIARPVSVQQWERIGLKWSRDFNNSCFSHFWSSETWKWAFASLW